MGLAREAGGEAGGTAYAAVELASKKITNATGQSFTAGKLGKFTVAAGHTILLGPPFVFNKSNISQFNF
jgi:rhamnose transport system substrate-binding protein